jgi:ADP-dependent phosphofructokinase/glucokinase
MDAALLVVKKRVDMLNEEYRNSEHFDLEYPEDAKMEHYTSEPEGPRGRLVASANDYKIQIFIKESNVVIKNEYLVN